MSDETLAMIRRTWDGVDSGASKVTVTNSSTPGQLLHALSCAPRDVPRLLAEVDRLRVENADLQTKTTRYLDRIDVLARKHSRAVAREGVLRQQRDQAAAQLKQLRSDLGKALDRDKGQNHD
ncbi:hypothetical protein [Actinomadura sp. CNU-125]|uniref:hypothetical protein n=1 Tax=Actinomadura sp. CNU-125 TaxID=1904961 RepID=UPI00117897D9|nr:hypothetical protein [Actinomadura sp. CNU-125]